MPLKIPTRTEVPQEFQDAIRDLAGKALEKIHGELAYANPRTAAYIKKEKAGIIARLGKVRRDQTTMDELVTKLRSLPYTRYAVVQFDGIRQFYGVTRDIFITNEERHVTYDMGPYHVYIPFDNFLGSDHFYHFIPARDPRAEYWHPHHRRNGHTCWGSFNSVVTNLLGEADVVEFFRTVAIYLERYNPHSVLTSSLEHNDDNGHRAPNYNRYPYMKVVTNANPR